MSEIVRALARGRTEATFEPVGDLELKGLSEPLRTHRVMWTPLDDPGADRRLPPMLVAGAASPYIGRPALLDRLRATWSATSASGGSAVLLAGEPGVGKTWTAAEVAAGAWADGAMVLYGRCEEELGVPYQPFVEALDLLGSATLPGPTSG